MILPTSSWILFAGCFGQATAAVLFGVHDEPIHNSTAKFKERVQRAPFGITAAVAPTAFNTIYLSGDPRRVRTAGFGFDFRVDQGAGVWAPCPTTVLDDESECMVGFCVDVLLCTTPCGHPNARGLKTITCTERGREYCSTAFLTQIKSMTPVSNFACASDIEEMHYMGFTTDTPETVFEAESSSAATKTRLSSSTSTDSTKASTNTTPPITEAPSPPNTLGVTGPSSSSARDSNSGSGNNIGVIVGGVIGGLAVVCGSALGAVWLFHRSRRENVKASASDSSSGSEGSLYFAKAELDADTSQRPELMGYSRSELPGKGPAAYDTSAYRPASYKPKSPVELPADNWL